MHFLYAFLFGLIIAASAGCAPMPLNRGPLEAHGYHEIRGKVVDVEYFGRDLYVCAQVEFESGEVFLFRIGESDPPRIIKGHEHCFFVSSSNYVYSVSIE